MHTSIKGEMGKITLMMLMRNFIKSKLRVRLLEEKYNQLSRLHNDMPVLVVVINSASVISNATHFCNPNYQDTTPHAKVITNLDVDLLVSNSLAISVSYIQLIKVYHS